MLRNVVGRTKGTVLRIKLCLRCERQACWLQEYHGMELMVCTRQAATGVGISPNCHMALFQSPSLAPAPALKANSMSDRSRDSNMSFSGCSMSESECSSTDEHEPARKKQASVASRAAGAQLQSRGSAFNAQVDESGSCNGAWFKDERMSSALLSPQRSSLKEKHTNACAQQEHGAWLGGKSNKAALLKKGVFPHSNEILRAQNATNWQFKVREQFETVSIQE
eukprot:1159653-Pelagomonas_calceolata.AAC.3